MPTYLPLNETMGVHSAEIGDTFVIRPNLLNQIRLSFNRVVPTITNLNPISLADLGGNFPGIRTKDPAGDGDYRPDHDGRRLHRERAYREPGHPGPGDRQLDYGAAFGEGGGRNGCTSII